MPLKALIVTVYNSENCGSFLQAIAMQTILQKKGFDVSFYHRSTKGTSRSFYKFLRSACNFLLHLKFKELSFLIKQRIAFSKAGKMLRIAKSDSRFFSEAEVVVLGSDTIWCFTAPYFKNNASRYLGATFTDKKVISYAASAGNTPKELFSEVVSECGGLNHISTCLVRDDHTKSLVALFDQDSEIVVDPTLLLFREDYRKMITKKPPEGKYLLLYFFGTVGPELREEIRKIAEQKGLKIVSLLKHRAWCDQSVPADPFEVLRYYENASYVITNTFHGCAFSLIFESNFAVHNEGKIKVLDVLNRYGEAKRLFSDPKEIGNIFSAPPKAEKSKIFERNQKESLQKLELALGI